MRLPDSFRQSIQGTEAYDEASIETPSYKEERAAPSESEAKSFADS